MAEKKRGKKRKDEYVGPGEDAPEKPSKEEYVVAKWLRKNVPIKKTKFLNYNVEYFTASRAVDALLESYWGKGYEPRFPSREAIVEFMDNMLRHKFFHRARKVPVTDQELKNKKKEKKSTTVESSDDKKKDEKEKEKVTDAESSVMESKPDNATEKEKRKRKIRLDMHNDQQFVDGLDAYVWIYDPIPFHYWFFGALLVVGAIGVCLFPLWPPSVRKGVYYLSVAAAGFLVFIIALAVLRGVVFCVLWVATMGKHNLWLLPNLTEDVGFFASFWPLYKYDFKGSDGTMSKKGDNKKKKKKDKDSDGEEEQDAEDTAKPTKAEDVGEPLQDERKLSQHNPILDEDQQNEKNEGISNIDGHAEEGGSESESESSQRSSTGRDFEMVDQDDLES